MKKRLLFVILTLWLLCTPVFAQTCAEHDLVLVEEAASCTEPGYRCYVCNICGHSEGYENIGILGHDFSEWTISQGASCTVDGSEQCTCSRCGEVLERDIPKLGHSYAATVVEATCTAGGYTSHVCSLCEDAFRTDLTEKLGHEYGEGVLTKEPTLDTMGRVTYSCLRCEESYTETTPKWDNPFWDLDKKAYYFTPVLWASNNGITTGISAFQFSPEGSCTRGQVVTFLWRMAGKPKPLSDQTEFADVPSDAYYRDAVLWAVEQGITNGVGEKLFAPDRVCTRCEVVTFLHRYMGRPEPKHREGFWDVAGDAYYRDSVYWAYEHEITKGVETNRFAPQELCTRGQIVTFLYRAKSLE